jgi:hypothetical protein
MIEPLDMGAIIKNNVFDLKRWLAHTVHKGKVPLLRVPLHSIW